MSRKERKSEDKILLSNIFLDKLDAKEIKAIKVPDNMRGSQSSFILLADEKENQSYVINLPSSLPVFRNLKASSELRNLIFQTEFSHPSLIEFLIFEKEVLLEKLIEHSEDAAAWYKKRHRAFISAMAKDGVEILSDSALSEYLDIYYNINCTKKFEGLTLDKMLSFSEDKAPSKKELEPLIPVILQKLISATLHIYILRYMHRDISLNNILFDKEAGALKLIDINAACDYDDKGKFNLSKDEAIVDGTLTFIPPEILIRNYEQNNCFNADVIDSFSIGVD